MALFFLAGVARPGDWPGWRGPLRDGISRETGLLTTWPENGPKVLWQAPAAAGYSSMALANDRLYTMFRRGDTLYSHKAVGVPGTVRGLALAHLRFGRLRHGVARHAGSSQSAAGCAARQWSASRHGHRRASRSLRPCIA